jgi:hypothetical protein
LERGERKRKGKECMISKPKMSRKASPQSREEGRREREEGGTCKILLAWYPSTVFVGKRKRNDHNQKS